MHGGNSDFAKLAVDLADKLLDVAAELSVLAYAISTRYRHLHEDALVDGFVAAR